MTEEWRPVVGFEGSYEVSDKGRVRSLDRIKIFERTDQYSGNKLIYPRLHKGKVLAPQPKEAGHLWVQLGRRAQVYVHHLVLGAFVGPAPAGMVCCHWDDDPGNNKLGNLRWDTRSANVADFVRNHGRTQGRQFQRRVG